MSKIWWNMINNMMKRDHIVKNVFHYQTKSRLVWLNSPIFLPLFRWGLVWSSWDPVDPILGSNPKRVTADGHPESGSPVEPTIPTGEHTFVHQSYVFYCFSVALVVSFHKSCVELKSYLNCWNWRLCPSSRYIPSRKKPNSSSSVEPLCD